MGPGLAVISKGAWWLVPTELKIILGWVLVLTEQASDGVPTFIDSIVSVYRVEDSTDF